MADTSKLINRYAQTLKFTVAVKGIPQLDMSIFRNTLLELEYSGMPLNIVTNPKYAGLFERLFGEYRDLLKLSVDEKTDAGEYTLKIELKDPESSYWDMGETIYVPITDGDGYGLRWINDNGTWVVKFVLLDEEGNPVQNGDGTYVEYNDGVYNLDGIKYKYSYMTSYVAIGEGDDCLLDEYGNPKQIEYGGTDAEGNILYNEYETGADGKVKIGRAHV